MGFSTVREAIDAIGRLGMVVVVDDEDRENEGDLVMAAEAASPENIAFFLSHTSGVICVPLLPERAETKTRFARPRAGVEKSRQEHKAQRPVTSRQRFI